MVLLADPHCKELLENFTSLKQAVEDIVAHVVIAKSLLDNTSKLWFASISKFSSFLVELIS